LATERPVRYTRAKSSERESRPPDRFTLGYADRRLRPLSRRRLSTALPARVATAVTLVRLVGPLHVSSILIIRQQAAPLPITALDAC